MCWSSQEDYVKKGPGGLGMLAGSAGTQMAQSEQQNITSWKERGQCGKWEWTQVMGVKSMS